jgi:glutamine synthetase
VGPDGTVLDAKDFFACNTFSVDQMHEHMPADVVRQFTDTLDSGDTLSTALANRIASAVLDWATQRGVTHFCHWFQPMTGSTAEKHDAFLSFDEERSINKFTGSQLIQSEPDASSFPSGGMRTTFEARGYTAWDPSSPMFIMEGLNGSTLCIPSVFISYHGDALDKKAPLLRSMASINTQAIRLLQLLGEEGVTKVSATAGPEQEYFLVDKAYAAMRPDLTIAGRTLLGAAAPKGQALDDHYFGSIPRRVQAFMHEVEHELYKLGVPAQTRHNEVAPSQFEIAILYKEANLAADQNQLVMEIISKVAERHDFLASMHEKPYAGLNGSGKHLNWSMADNLGRNLLNPGDSPENDLSFMAFLSATVLGVYRHGAVLRASIASHGNDFRLGANEAPPAIISVFLGNTLTRICDSIVAGQTVGENPEASLIELGVSHLPDVARDNTDRNRTSPFAFTGNKFEFRAVGSNQTISFPLMVVNTVVADGIAVLCDMIEKNGGGKAAVMKAITDALTESTPVRFEGNNYADAWVAEAKKRGLPNLRKAPEALAVLMEDSSVKLFSDHNVLTPAELASRFHVQVEQYTSTMEYEAEIMRNLIDQSVLPAAIAERSAMAADVTHVVSALGSAGAEDIAALKAFGGLIDTLRATRAGLDTAIEKTRGTNNLEQAKAMAATVGPAMEALREASNALEARISDANWTLPRYSEMLFQN